MYSNKVLELRRFFEVFPTLEEFTLRTKDYTFFPTYDLTTIFNRLQNLYYDNFYRYENLGTIYEFNGRFVSELINEYQTLEELKLKKDQLTNINLTTTKNYQTDNTESENVDGFLIDTNTVSSTSGKQLGETILLINTQMNKINNKYTTYVNNMLTYVYPVRYDNLNYGE